MPGKTLWEAVTDELFPFSWMNIYHTFLMQMTSNVFLLTSAQLLSRDLI